MANYLKKEDLDFFSGTVNDRVQCPESGFQSAVFKSLASRVQRPESSVQGQITIKGRKKLSCRHERQIREDKSAEQKAKAYQ